MSFKTEYGEAFIFNSMTIYSIEFDNDKLNMIYRNMELLFDKLYRLNHNRVFNQGELLSVIKFLENHTLSIKRITDESEELRDLIVEVLFVMFNDIILIAEEYDLFEMCANMLQIANLITDYLKK
jgi:hypothetical protein